MNVEELAEKWYKENLKNYDAGCGQHLVSMIKDAFKAGYKEGRYNQSKAEAKNADKIAYYSDYHNKFS